MWIKRTIGEQRKILTALFEPTMSGLAKQCVNLWLDLENLDKLLNTHFASIPHCHLLYAVDKFGKQVSANVNAEGVDVNYRGQDLSRRPYSVSLYPKRHFTLSSVYISQATGHPCISAVQPVMDEQQFLGFVIADFDVNHLPLFMTPADKNAPLLHHYHLNNLRPQPSPNRTLSLLDHHMDDTLSVLEKLISEHGVFFCLLHYSSAQAMLWQVDDPYQYRLYGIEQILDPSMYSAYPQRAYPPNAIISTKQVRLVLERFQTLRLADDSLYLRSGSINIVNGVIGLSFSYDGSQYMPVEVFLNKDLSFWLGQTAVNAN